MGVSLVTCRIPRVRRGCHSSVVTFHEWARSLMQFQKYIRIVHVLKHLIKQRINERNYCNLYTSYEAASYEPASSQNIFLCHENYLFLPNQKNIIFLQKTSFYAKTPCAPKNFDETLDTTLTGDSINCVPRHPAAERDLSNHTLPLGHHVPKLDGTFNASWEATAHADDGDCLPNSLSTRDFILSHSFVRTAVIDQQRMNIRRKGIHGRIADHAVGTLC